MARSIPTIVQRSLPVLAGLLLGSGCSGSPGGDGSGSGTEASATGGTNAMSADAGATAGAVDDTDSPPTDGGSTPDSDSDDVDGDTTGPTGTSTTGEDGADSGSSSGTGGAVGSCTVDADGCCSDLIMGGQDPDCPSMDCDALERTAAVELPNLNFPNESRRGGTAIAWNGASLWTMRMDWVDDSLFADHTFVFEEHDETGASVQQVLIEPEGGEPSLAAYGPTALAYHQGSGVLAFGYQLLTGTRIAAIDPEGTLLWDGPFLGPNCNFGSRIEVTSYDAGFAAAVDLVTCGDGTESARVWRFSPDGTPLAKQPFDYGDPAHAPGFACGTDCAEIVAVYRRSIELLGGVVDVAAETLTETTLAPVTFGAVDYSAVVFNGDNYFVVTNEHPNANGRLLTRGIWAPDTGWLNPRLTTPIAHEGPPPSAVWTGDGYVLAVATHADLPAGQTPDRDEHQLLVYHFGLDGTIRSELALDPEAAGTTPQLAYAGGRVAVSWVRTATDPEERYLSFLECAR